MKILIIDDCMETAFSLSELCNVLGHQSKYITDAKQASKYAETDEIKSYDYILLDLYLNGITGISIFKTLQKNNYGNKVVFISGCNSQSDIFQQALKFNVPLVTKQFDAIELIEHMQSGTIKEWADGKITDCEGILQ